MADVEAIVSSKLSTWKLCHLGLWADLIEPPAVPAKPVSTAELMEMEDLAAAAKFREIKAKIQQDQSDMATYNAQQAEGERRTHVVMVMHEKAQVQIGKSYLDPYFDDGFRSFPNQDLNDLSKILVSFVYQSSIDR